MQPWTITNQESLKNAMRCIDENGKKIVFVVDLNQRLIGSLSDGDIRRWILKNGTIDAKTDQVMNKRPMYVYGENAEEAYEIMQKQGIDGIPAVDREKKIIKVFFWKDFSGEERNKYGKIDLPVVIMAGGQGTRLYPYTKVLPKPLIPIGDVPIVERIMDRFHNFGCQDFYMTVNYKKNMIQSYFAETQKNYAIKFIEETFPMGTAGSLSLIRSEVKTPFFLSNCDILVEADYSSVLRYHQENNNKMTIIASLKTYVIPYGVLCLDETSKVKSIKEKPEHHYLVNTGVYIIEPELLERIPQNCLYHMTHLIEDCMKEGIGIGVYPVSEEDWLDMGELKEMDIMIRKLGVTK